MTGAVKIKLMRGHCERVEAKATNRN